MWVQGGGHAIPQARGLRGAWWSYRDFWSLLVTPDIPAHIHPEGYQASWVPELLGQDEDAHFGASSVYSDGSVKWPRWKVAATGGWALLQRHGDQVSNAFAVSAAARLCQTSDFMDMNGLLSGVESLPSCGTVQFGIDCQMVVAGFVQRLWLADDDRAVNVGTWRLINEAMDRLPQVAAKVFKIKAHRSVDQVAPDGLEDCLGNEAVDLLAKQAATDRTSIELMKLAKAKLAGRLAKARRVVQWLADQAWPDSKGHWQGTRWASAAEGCSRRQACP